MVRIACPQVSCLKRVLMWCVSGVFVGAQLRCVFVRTSRVCDLRCFASWQAQFVTLSTKSSAISRSTSSTSGSIRSPGETWSTISLILRFASTPLSFATAAACCCWLDALRCCSAPTSAPTHTCTHRKSQKRQTDRHTRTVKRIF